MPAQSQVSAAERELSARRSDLTQYQFILDDATDSEAITKAMADVATAKLLVERAERKVAKARAGLTEAEVAERRAARVAAGQRVEQTLGELASVEATIESHAIGLINAILHRGELADQITLSTYQAGIASPQRNHLLDMRHIDAFLANGLSRSGIAGRLNFVTVNGVQHLDNGTSLRDLTAERHRKLTLMLEKALA
jgi:hypothetical protein